MYAKGDTLSSRSTTVIMRSPLRLKAGSPPAARDEQFQLQAEQMAKVPTSRSLCGVPRPRCAACPRKGPCRRSCAWRSRDVGRERRTWGGGP
eukprot:6542365-Heterocapsa_arctica.AAC.1